MKIPARKLLIIPLGFLLLHLVALPALAQCNSGCCKTPIGCIPTNIDEVGKWFFNELGLIALLLAIIVFIAGGYQIMTAGDDPKALQAGRTKIFAAVAGFAFFIAARTIINALKWLVGT